MWDCGTRWLLTRLRLWMSSGRLNSTTWRKVDFARRASTWTEVNFKATWIINEEIHTEERIHARFSVNFLLCIWRKQVLNVFEEINKHMTECWLTCYDQRAASCEWTTNHLRCSRRRIIISVWRWKNYPARSKCRPCRWPPDATAPPRIPPRAATAWRRLKTSLPNVHSIATIFFATTAWHCHICVHCYKSSRSFSLTPIQHSKWHNVHECSPRREALSLTYNSTQWCNEG